MFATNLFLSALLLLTCAGDELDKAADLFAGPLEAVGGNFSWLESPLWSEAGQYLLFSDVKWADKNGVTCGMIYKYSDQEGFTEFLECSGLVGPGETPDNIADYVEGGSNGLFWGWNGDGDLLACQHGKHRIVRFNVQDVEDGKIDPSRVQVLVDSYNGTVLNSPNDLYLDEDNTLYFTDPAFGRQYKSAQDPLENAFATMPQELGVYKIVGDPAALPVEPERVLNFGRPDPWEAPNGVTVTSDGAIVVAITDFEDPHVLVFPPDGESIRLETEYRIEGENADFSALTDSLTYSPELNSIFVAGPGGVYIYNSAAPYDLLGLLRINDLNSNNVVGGGYLWITANQRLLRIPLAEDSVVEDPGESPMEENADPIEESADPAGRSGPTELKSSAPRLAVGLGFLVAMIGLAML